MNDHASNLVVSVLKSQVITSTHTKKYFWRKGLHFQQQIRLRNLEGFSLRNVRVCQDISRNRKTIVYSMSFAKKALLFLLSWSLFYFSLNDFNYSKEKKVCHSKSMPRQLTNTFLDSDSGGFTARLAVIFFPVEVTPPRLRREFVRSHIDVLGVSAWSSDPGVIVHIFAYIRPRGSMSQ